MPIIEAFQTVHPAPKIVPAWQDRRWMDETVNKYAYRCTPMTIANTSGWFVLNPSKFTLRWNGQSHTGAIQVESEALDVLPGVSSQFGWGVFSCQCGYLFRTDPEWDLLVSGPPNSDKDGVVPLQGIVETGWLPYPFLFNWKFTSPGEVTFEEGEPIGMVRAIPHDLESQEMVIRDITSDQEWMAKYAMWEESRTTFLDSEERWKGGWQKFYVRGNHPDGTRGYPEGYKHHSKRRLKQPIIRGEDDD